MLCLFIAGYGGILQEAITEIVVLEKNSERASVSQVYAETKNPPGFEDNFCSMVRGC